MLTLPELLTKVFNKKSLSEFDKIVHCLKLDSRLIRKGNEVTSFLGCFTFTLVTKGSFKLELRDQIFTFNPGEFIIYFPGTFYKITENTEDVEVYCIIADEKAVYDSPMASILLQSLCFPFSQNIVRFNLPENLYDHLKLLLERCIQYNDSEHFMKKEVIGATVSIIFAEMINFVFETVKPQYEISANTNFVVKFLRSLRENYNKEHSVAFYANQLNITPTHLSRVIKQISGLTVQSHINRLLIMDASWKLQSSSLPIAEISDFLNFADQASFSKFFKRHKGISPTEFRDKYNSLKN